MKILATAPADIRPRLLATFYRLISRVGIDRVSGCWIWKGSALVNGYGQFGRYPLASTTAHRAMWESVHGPIPTGFDICHRCDVRPCINPEHLFLGTRLENMRDAAAKGRVQRGESRYNSKLSESSVLQIRACSLRRGDLTKLASEFNVNQQTVGDVVRRRSWRHL